MTAFHDEAFDAPTKLKLEIFRGYVREWLPVFLTRSRTGQRGHTKVGIYDFFAGPGHDKDGYPGSPLIIIQELKQFCNEREQVKDQDVDIRVVLNDADIQHIETLKAEVAKIACGRGCCAVEYSALPFSDALEANLPRISDAGSASLIIMDQFGVKEVTPEIIRNLADCRRTDILFFISSSFVRRFVDTREIAATFDADAQGIRTVEYNATHRFICNYFRRKLGDAEYYLAPFSIKKGANIYGVIYGTGNLLGLEKFLDVCWKVDRATGEANYNIDGDFAWAGQRSLFAEQNVIRKIDLFEHDLREFIRTRSPTNHDMYKFCLTKGFRPMHAVDAMRTMQHNGEIKVLEVPSDLPARAGAFYLSYDHYKNDPRVRFAIGGEQ